jgi:predicted metal-dependent enzyme (double-stranded beta helix superfamily)
VIGWPPSSVIELHDHGYSVGAAVVVSGVLEETSVIGNPDDHVTTSTRTLSEGSSIRFATGYIHGIVNTGPSTAVSLHV